MTDRQKVIKGLKHCAEYGCKGCPYGLDCACADGFSTLAWDALVELEMKPRVMTLEELENLPKKNHKSVGVCVEERYPIDIWDGGSFLKWCGSDYIHDEYMADNVYYNKEMYGISWRAWTGRPSKKQRAAKAWIERTKEG